MSRLPVRGVERGLSPPLIQIYQERVALRRKAFAKPPVTRALQALYKGHLILHR